MIATMLAFRELMIALILTFYLGFVGYMLVPAVGPRAILDIRYENPMYLIGVNFYKPFSAMWNDLQSFQRDCFPSLHTAISSVVLFFCYKFDDLFPVRRLLFWIMLPFAQGSSSPMRSDPGAYLHRNPPGLPRKPTWPRHLLPIPRAGLRTRPTCRILLRTLRQTRPRHTSSRSLRP